MDADDIYPAETSTLWDSGTAPIRRHIQLVITTGIPRLSVRAEAAIGAVTLAKDDAARRAAWRAVQADPDIHAELTAFRASNGDSGPRACASCRTPVDAAGAVQLLGMAHEEHVVDRMAQVWS
jgi:hypothetical protein